MHSKEGIRIPGRMERRGSNRLIEWKGEVVID